MIRLFRADPGQTLAEIEARLFRIRENIKELVRNAVRYAA